MKATARILFLTLLVYALPSLALNGYVGCSSSDSADPFDLTSYAFGTGIDLLPWGNYPYDATISPDGSEVWIPGASGDGVVVINRASGTVSHTIFVGEYPVSVAFSSDGLFALVACRDGEGLWKVDTSTYSVTSITSLPTNYQGAGNIALDPVSGQFYVVDWYDELLFEMSNDGNTVLRQADLGNSLWQLVVSPDGTVIYVTDRGTDQIRVIDRETLTQLETWPVGDDPWGVDVSADGSMLVVACEDSHEAWIIHTATGQSNSIILNSLADPRDVDILDEDGLAFLAGGSITGADPIYVLSLSDEIIVGILDAPGGNTNVIAVQAQMHGDGTDVVELPRVLNLSAYPNPFNPKTEIHFTLKRGGSVSLAVFDTTGRRQRRLISASEMSAGDHSIVWDGRDDSGEKVVSGIYLLSLQSAELNEQRKLVLLK
ncbi:beta-propeller fold lactonase family protein [bacterium]|nr:beta-propeller fold lactonase family protein [bacterium]